MKCEQVSMSAEVYNLEGMGGVNGLWLWDFGILTLVGSEHNPTARIGNMEVFSAVANDFDVENLADEEPYKKEEVTVFMGDYTTYVPTSESSSTHVISEDQKPYRVLEDDVEVDGDKHVVLEEDRSSGRKDRLAVPADGFNEEWDPVMEI